jgi:hypothetical protein
MPDLFSRLGGLEEEPSGMNACPDMLTTPAREVALPLSSDDLN